MSPQHRFSSKMYEKRYQAARFPMVRASRKQNILRLLAPSSFPHGQLTANDHYYDLTPGCLKDMGKIS